MKRATVLMLVFFCCHFSAAWAAEDASRVGLGISLSPGVGVTRLAVADELDLEYAPFFNVTFSSLSLPILLHSRVRLEPEFALMAGNDGPSEFSRITRLGVSLSRVYSSSSSALVYGGLRLGMLRWAEGDDDFVTSVELGAVAGGECFLAPMFSIGGEGQLNAALAMNDGSDTMKAVGTHLVLFLRFYFV